jgi:hypothetical protein
MGILSDTASLAATAENIRPATHGLVCSLQKAGVPIRDVLARADEIPVDTIVLRGGDVISVDYGRSMPYVDLLFHAAWAPEQEHFIDRIRQEPSSDLALAINRLVRLLSWSGRSGHRRLN